MKNSLVWHEEYIGNVRFHQITFVKTCMLHDFCEFALCLVSMALCAEEVIVHHSQFCAIFALLATTGFCLCAVLVLYAFNANVKHLESIVREDREEIEKAVNAIDGIGFAIQHVFYASCACMFISFLALTTGW